MHQFEFGDHCHRPCDSVLMTATAPGASNPSIPSTGGEEDRGRPTTSAPEGRNPRSTFRSRATKPRGKVTTAATSSHRSPMCAGERVSYALVDRSRCSEQSLPEFRTNPVSPLNGVCGTELSQARRFVPTVSTAQASGV